jgi:drug/metabolite transporter (DMT)-like permease
VSGSPLRGRVLFAYIVLCIVWGSTFLAIRIGVRSFPPALLAGTRFLSAGVVLTGLTLMLGRRLPQRAADWKTAAVVGTLLLAGGNGLVVGGARFVESGTTAIFVAGGALWMAVLDAVIPGSEARVTWVQLLGLLVGYSGTLLLVGASMEGLRRADWRAPAMFLSANVCWGLGAVYSKRHPVETSPDMNAAVQMVIGGGVLLLAGMALGEWRGFAPTVAGWAAIGYLMVFGSIIGYSCFVYVLRHTSPTVTATYYYVNTVIAVLLGGAILHEEITPRTIIAVLAVLGSVILVHRSSRPEPVT